MARHQDPISIIFIQLMKDCSQALEVIVRRDGMEFQHKYSRGKPITTLTCHVLPPESRGTQGTCIRFWPDKEGLTLFFPY